MRGTIRRFLRPEIVSRVYCGTSHSDVDGPAYMPYGIDSPPSRYCHCASLGKETRVRSESYVNECEYANDEYLPYFYVHVEA